MLTKEEKFVLKKLVDIELKEFVKEGDSVIFPSLKFLKAEEEYKEFLKVLKKKL